jgi:hypothetical protein
LANTLGGGYCLLSSSLHDECGLALTYRKSSGHWTADLDEELALLLPAKKGQVGHARERGGTQGFMKILVDAETKKVLGAGSKPQVGITGRWPLM